MIMAQGDYLPGTYSRVGTEENPGTYYGSVEQEIVFECK